MMTSGNTIYLHAKNIFSMSDVSYYNYILFKLLLKKY